MSFPHLDRVLKLGFTSSVVPISDALKTIRENVHKEIEKVWS
jgi:hypothetical protein